MTAAMVAVACIGIGWLLSEISHELRWHREERSRDKAARRRQEKP